MYLLKQINKITGIFCIQNQGFQILYSVQSLYNDNFSVVKIKKYNSIIIFTLIYINIFTKTILKQKYITVFK